MCGELSFEGAAVERGRSPKEPLSKTSVSADAVSKSLRGGSKEEGWGGVQEPPSKVEAEEGEGGRKRAVSGIHRLKELPCEGAKEEEPKRREGGSETAAGEEGSREAGAVGGQR